MDEAILLPQSEMIARHRPVFEDAFALARLKPMSDTERGWRFFLGFGAACDLALLATAETTTKAEAAKAKAEAITKLVSVAAEMASCLRDKDRYVTVAEAWDSSFAEAIKLFCTLTVRRVGVAKLLSSIVTSYVDRDCGFQSLAIFILAGAFRLESEVRPEKDGDDNG